MRICNLAVTAAIVWKTQANYNLRDIFETKPNLVWKGGNVKSWDDLTVGNREKSGSTNIKPRSPESNVNICGRDAKLFTRAPKQQMVATTNARATLAAAEDDAVLFIFGRGITGGVIRQGHRNADITAITSKVAGVEQAARNRAILYDPRDHPGNDVALRGVLFGSRNDGVDSIRQAVRDSVLGAIRIDRKHFRNIPRAAGYWMYDADLHSRSVRQIWEGPEGSDVTSSSEDTTSSSSPLRASIRAKEQRVQVEVRQYLLAKGRGKGHRSRMAN